MKLKQLAIKISKLAGFRNPKIDLEQYTTHGDIVARWILSAVEFGDLGPGSRVIDLGCGTGVLGLAALMCGGSSAIMVDIDDQAIETMTENAKSLGLKGLIFPICKDIKALPDTEGDVILCNPPWGKQKQGADSDFIQTIKDLALPSYVLHSSGAKHLENEFLSAGWRTEKVFTMPFELSATYPHHTRRRMTTEATLWRLIPP